MAEDLSYLREKVDALAAGQADMNARLNSIDSVLREHREDDKRRAEKIELAEERRMQALLIADEKRAIALREADAERAKILAKTDARIARLEVEAASVRGFKKHVLGVVLSVLTAIATAWAALRMGLGGGDR